MNKEVQRGADTGELLQGAYSRLLQAVPFRRSYPKLSILSSSKITQKQFINIINFHNFVDEQVFIQVVYPLTKEEFLFRVIPGPCIGSELTCNLPEGTRLSFDNYLLKSLVIDDGKSIMIMQVDPIHISSQSITVKFRKSGTIYDMRDAKRFSCQMVDAILQQKNIKIKGSLEEFNPLGLRIALKDNVAEVISSLNPAQDISIRLSRGDKEIFSGFGSLIRVEERVNIIVVTPRNIPHKRDSQRKLRNPRINFSPTPKVLFEHPLTLKRVAFDVVDVTTSGFSVIADSHTSLLMPGMIIDNVTITRSGLYQMKLFAQVVYSSPQKKGKMKYGFTILDIDWASYNQLFDMYCNSVDKHANFSRDVNMDLLWEFFFESGFIYPKKYLCFSQYKENYKKTYERLYHHSPEIFANFTYQENDAIYGHVSIIKSYERTWMIHHLAAKPMGTKRTGLFVLNHILNYFDGFYRMPSIGMKYMIFYFRPENRFPDHFFGGFCRELNDPKRCSMDCLAYLTNPLPPKETSLPEDWALQECSIEDINDLQSGYNSLSGGLMIDSFCLDKNKVPTGTIENLYGKYGLKRRYTAHVLKHDHKPKAYMIVDESDRGINLSELLNSIKVIITDSTGLPWDILHASLGRFVEIYGTRNVPVLVYPHRYVDSQGIKYDKKYNLWVLGASASDDYTEHLKKQARIRPVRLFLKILLAKFLNR
jgi:hypothetical protein